MIYTLMTMKAMKLAYASHQGQYDKSGIPYIFHPYHLAEQMEDEVTCTVALLHDVVEDTSVTMEELEQEFPKEVTDALRLLTHEDDVEYYDYVKAIKNNPIAKAVKYADIMHNSDHSRLIGCDIPEEKAKYWESKYKKALEVLMEE